MHKPEVRVIETQMEEVKTVEVSNWEKQQLLAKYGYTNHPNNHHQTSPSNPTSDLPYEELIRLEDQKYQMELERKMMEMRNRPKSFTIDTDQVRYNETRWSNIDDTNIGFEVTIVSDMKIPGMRY